jgi:nucleotide-binding universal stress UspA family protein
MRRSPVAGGAGYAEDTSKEKGLHMKILLAIDGSPFTKRMLAYLAAHAENWLRPDSEVTVLTVVPTVPPRAAAVVAKETLKAYYADEAETVFKPVRSFLTRRGVKVTEVTRQGHAAEQIAKFADSGKFELLVMGSHGHGALASLMVGSVASKVLANSKVPVLIVR